MILSFEPDQLRKPYFKYGKQILNFAIFRNFLLLL